MGRFLKKTVLFCVSFLVISNLGFAKVFDWRVAKSGVRLSSVDLDEALFDDTVGVGVFYELPYNQVIKVGGGVDFWQTGDRYTEKDYLRDLAFSGYGKYFLRPHSLEVAPYATLGLGMHFLRYDRYNGGNHSSRKLSLDMGVGVETKLTQYVSLSGEIKFRNLKRYDYSDYAVGAVAKF